MELSSRLNSIMSLVPLGARVADIGTDHALLPISLIKNGISPKVVASDLNKKPYLAALQHVRKSGSADRIDVRKGDGLEVIKTGEVDVIVIAGMGGSTIAGILERSPEVLRDVGRLILQPMTDAPLLRTWLNKNGWRLVREKLVKDDGRIYLVIAAEPGIEEFEDDFLLEIGPLLVKHCSPVLIEYLEKMEEDYRRVLFGLSKSRTPESMKKAIDLTARLAKLREVINRCK